VDLLLPEHAHGRPVPNSGGRPHSQALARAESAPSQAWDDAVLAAIGAAGPFPPLPTSYAYETLELDCHVAPYRLAPPYEPRGDFH
jgi:hypothetical protein